MATYEIIREETISHTYIVKDVETEDEAFEAFATGDYVGEVTETIFVNDDTAIVREVRS